ncbi:unnamed protein product [Cuscuta campestris]|uniref:Uncharacterized protein n=1 Tax=Cuscuta campestris TaxID=132261 RepID=A0A484KSU0_9ASTE|nr:unnamed protein product [Cuscuta campestris]
MKRLQAAAKKVVLPMPGVDIDDLDYPKNLLVDGIADRAEAIEAAQKKQKMSALEKQFHEELKRELQDSQPSTISTEEKAVSEDNNANHEPVLDLEQFAKDDDNMIKMGMTRKKRKILEAAEIGKKRRKDKVALLEEEEKAREFQEVRSRLS